MNDKHSREEKELSTFTFPDKSVFHTIRINASMKIEIIERYK